MSCGFCRPPKTANRLTASLQRVGRSIILRSATPKRRAERLVGATISMVSFETTKLPRRSTTLTKRFIGFPILILPSLSALPWFLAPYILLSVFAGLVERRLYSLTSTLLSPATGKAWMYVCRSPYSAFYGEKYFLAPEPSRIRTFSAPAHGREPL